MRFQHFTPWITDEDVARTSFTPDLSKNYQRIMNSELFSGEAERMIERIFEDVRVKEYGHLPSRKNCIYMFDLGLDPIRYARSMWNELFAHYLPQMNLVEVEIEGRGDSSFARVDRSLVTCRFNSAGTISVSDEQIYDDARKYWAGTKRSDHETEILYCGQFKYLRIIRNAERS